MVFVHLPRTGGTTIERVLDRKYRSRVLHVETLREPLASVGDLPFDERAAARVVAGHVHYGVHEHIPHECVYVTMLREPVSRVVSMYHFIRGNPKHWLHDELVRSGMGLEEFARTAADPGSRQPADAADRRHRRGRARTAAVRAGYRGAGDGETEPARLPGGRSHRALQRELHPAPPGSGLEAADVHERQRCPRTRRARRSATTRWRRSGRETGSTSSSTTSPASSSRGPSPPMERRFAASSPPSRR